jgi:transposase
MPASYVKAYVKTHKNDANDAEAICEAVQRPNMRFVPTKNVQQQAVLSLHRVRKLLIGQRVALSNSLRGILVEFGIVVPKRAIGISEAFQLIEDESCEMIPPIGRTALRLLGEQYKTTGRRIERCTKQIESWHKKSPDSRRLGTVPGVGALAASALVATVGDAQQFRSGREMAAWLGLVPLQKSSGGRQVLGRISKRGDSYLRGLLYMGAMSVLRGGDHSKHYVVRWAAGLAKRKSYRLASVALANKLARIAWAVLAKGENFREPTHQMSLRTAPVARQKLLDPTKKRQ